MLLTKKKDTQPPPSPPPAAPLVGQSEPVYQSLNDLPEWQNGLAKLQQLNTRRQELETKLRELQGKAQNARDQVRNIPAIDLLAQQLLEEKADLDNLPPPQPPLGQQIGDVQQKLNVVKRAIELYQQEMERLRQRLSPQIARQYQPAHREIVRKIALHLAELMKALRAEMQVHDCLDVQGVSHLALVPGCGLPALGSAQDSQGIVAYWVREAIKNGFVKSDEEFLKGLSF